MEQKRLEGCTDQIMGLSNEVLDALDGIDLLHKRVCDLVLGMGEKGGEEIKELESTLFTFLDILRITLAHARTHTDFIQEVVTEIRTDGYKDLSVINGGAK